MIEKPAWFRVRNEKGMSCILKSFAAPPPKIGNYVEVDGRRFQILHRLSQSEEKWLNSASSEDIQDKVDCSAKSV
jgi:hypothetical protein